MNIQRTCQTFSLEAVLRGESDAATEREFEQHLESCDDCRARLNDLAAADAWWQQASGHLSTLADIALPAAVTLPRLRTATSMVVASPGTNVSPSPVV